MLAEPTRTAVYGPVCTVVWQGSAGDRRPYADQVGMTNSVQRWYQIPLTPLARIRLSIDTY